jgi:SSS family solute:Na+ symporter
MWRGIPQSLLIILLPIAAITVLRLPEFSAKAVLINESLKHIGNATIEGQMRVPITMAHILPIGIKGLLATIMLFISFTCHDTYMHSWGAIFVQDVVNPIRNKPMTPEQHIKLLRWSIIGVAVFSFIWSCYFKLNMPIYMYFAITGTIWLGGSGAVIIGGLYWRKGTTAGAYWALSIGAVLGLIGLIVPEWYKAHYDKPFPVNGQWLWLIAMVTAALAYIIVSLLTSKKRSYNLERMFHRGKYRLESDAAPIQKAPKSKWLLIVGITEEFSFADKCLAVALLVWNGANFTFFVVFSLINLFMPVADSAWAKYWHFNILLSLCLSIPAVIWFTVGGVIDMKALFHTLTTSERDVNDNGQVLERYDEDDEKEHPTTPIEDIEDQLTALMPEADETSVDTERK